MAKYKTYSFWQKVYHVVIKFSLIFTLVFIFSNCKSQKIEIPSVIEESYYYQIINTKSRKKNKNYKKTIDFIKNNPNYSKDRKAFFLKKVDLKKKEKRNYIFHKQDNKFLISSIKKNLQNGGSLLDYFGEKKLNIFLNTIKKETLLKEKLLDSSIVVTKSSDKYWHKFSTPIIFEKQILLYHYKKTTNYFNDEILFYKIQDDKLILKKKFFSPIVKPCKKEILISNKIERNYSIINNLVLSDTLIKSKILKLKKKYSKETMEEIQQKGSFIFLHYNNKSIIRYIEDNLLNGGHLLNYFCKNQLESALYQIQKKGKDSINRLKLNPLIKITKSDSDYGHKFSLPIIIDDNILIFHSNKKSKYNISSEVLIYKTQQNKKPILVKRYYSYSL